MCETYTLCNANLLQHQPRVIQSVDDEVIQRIHIRRSRLFSNALRQFSRGSSDVSKMLQVRFVGEEAVDEGGPHREFFHLLMTEIFKLSLFSGFPSHVIPRHNMQAVADNTFYYVGNMISTCIVQSGEVPSCFLKACTD